MAAVDHVSLPSRVTKRVLNEKLLPSLETEADARRLVITLNETREWFPEYTRSVVDPEADGAEEFLAAVAAVEAEDADEDGDED